MSSFVPKLGRQSTGGHDMSLASDTGTVDVLMIGTGEYTTGYVHGAASDSDKGAGVVALTMMDLRRRGKTRRLALAGVNGKKFPGIRAHMQRNISAPYSGISTECETFPGEYYSPLFLFLSYTYHPSLTCCPPVL
jgi:hypothetical protein